MDIDGLVAYLQELRANNNKAWFDANRPRYDILRRQFTDLVAEVISQTSRFDPSVGEIDPAQALFRINRDIRFSKDKTPYKVAFSAAFMPQTKGECHAGYYVMIHADDELLVGAGIHEPSPAQLARFRGSISEHGKKLLSVVNAGDFKSRFGELEGEKLKKIPSNYPPDHPYAELLKHKSMTVGATVQATEMKPEKITEYVISSFEIAYPFVKTLREFIA